MEYALVISTVMPKESCEILPEIYDHVGSTHSIHEEIHECHDGDDPAFLLLEPRNEITVDAAIGAILMVSLTAEDTSKSGIGQCKVLLYREYEEYNNTQGIPCKETSKPRPIK